MDNGNVLFEECDDIHRSVAQIRLQNTVAVSLGSKTKRVTIFLDADKNVLFIYDNHLNTGKYYC